MTARAKVDFSTAVGRWAGLGPYYAMFPVDFAFDVIRTYTEPGGAVLDPFAGRASSVFAAAVEGRSGHAIEINPVGWLYGQVKLNPASLERVLRRAHAIGRLAAAVTEAETGALPEFFRHCYAPQVLRYLLAARRHLRWRRDCVDATLMAIMLVYLHGKREASLSNQMRQGKAMAPDYSVSWWRERALAPPEVEPVEFLAKRIKWRYAKGTPSCADARMVFGDSTTALKTLRRKVRVGTQRRFDLLFTSPPYYDVTNYHYDQWLRLWLLGGPVRPGSGEGPWRGRFSSASDYRNLLARVFRDCAAVMTDRAVAYIRTDARPLTLSCTVDALERAFPGRSITQLVRPFAKDTQTALYGDRSKKPGEVDIVVSR